MKEAQHLNQYLNIGELLMDRRSSILYLTGQAWKFWFMPMGVVVGFIPIVEAQLIKNSGQDHLFLVFLLISISIEITAVAFPAITIKCPKCGTRWYWLAMSKPKHGRFYEQLFQSRCPVCGLDKKPNN